MVEQIAAGASHRTMKIASLDFETANFSRVSACSAGIALFEDGQLVESKSWLIKPPKGHGFFLPEWTAEVHGLNWFSVRNAPEFPAIAPEIVSRLVQADIVIAHNTSFDMNVLGQTLLHFELSCPPFRHLCTWQLAKAAWPALANHRLNTLAGHIGLSFQHHDAESDAIAAGHVMLALMRQLDTDTLDGLTNRTGIQPGLFNLTQPSC